MDGNEVLLSAGQDAKVVVWSVLSGRKMYVVPNVFSRGILDLCLAPSDSLAAATKGYTSRAGPTEPTTTADTDRVLVWAASSLGELSLVSFSPSASSTLHTLPSSTHATSINRVRVDDEGDVWTASSDNSSKRLAAEQRYQPDTDLRHPDYVRDVLPFSALGLAVTACRDESVRVWSTADARPVASIDAHFDEVTCLAPARVDGKIGVVSGSIDGTVRFWSLLKPDLDAVFKDQLLLGKTGDTSRNDAEEKEKPESKPKQFMGLTEDEQRELDELMDSDDD